MKYKTHRGGANREGAVFFKEPDKIGNILSAESDYVDGDPAKRKKLFGPKLYFGQNSFIGSGGFAIYGFEGQFDNLVKNTEFKFLDIDSVIYRRSVDMQHGIYGGTKYWFYFCKNDRIIHKVFGKHYEKEETSVKLPFEYYFYESMLKSWWEFKINTKLLLEQLMEEEIMFNVLLTVNEIDRVDYKIFVSKKGIRVVDSNHIETNYPANDIGRIYLDKNLYWIIEHKNFKSNWWSSKGDMEGLPYDQISDLPVFEAAIEHLLGFKIKTTNHNG